MCESERAAGLQRMADAAANLRARTAAAADLRNSDLSDTVRHADYDEAVSVDRALEMLAEEE